MKQYLVYTALVGSTYDNIISLSRTDERFDYICFVRKGDKKSDFVGNWRIVEIDTHVDDNARLSRFPKLQPHRTEVLNYEYSLYIDANINIKGDDIYERFIELVKNEEKIALLKHPFRDCVYQEAYVCIASLKGGILDIIKQICSLKMNGIKAHSGLYEANLIFRKHNDNEIIEFDNLWWDTFMKYSKRDQLSLVYALYKLSLSPNYFLKPGLTTRNHPSLEKLSHNIQSTTPQMDFKRKVMSVLQIIFKPLLKEDNRS